MDPGNRLVRLCIKASAKTHLAVYLRTGGCVGHRFGRTASTLILEHTGAKTGTPRRSPLFYIEDGDDLVIVASYHGASQHPAWYHNLRACPQATVRVGREIRTVRARIADDVERVRLWAKAVEAYKPYEAYRRLAAKAGRTIPIVVLEADEPSN